MLASFLSSGAVYLGCAKMRGLLRDLLEDEQYWEQVSRMAPVLQAELRASEAQRDDATASDESAN